MEEPFTEAQGEMYAMYNLLCTDKYGFFLLLSAFYVSELREGEETYVRLI